MSNLQHLESIASTQNDWSRFKAEKETNHVEVDTLSE